ncbi:MAG: hypothetical protein E6860_01210 [Clostridium sp.]|uniref:hypothetical protein n=1 Tax=Clostridium sp. TaxID=1506 RepID=UPI0028FFF009|nr:hypothetical protein [Clostridium sp.]MDU1584142.1 hypothetical protein [Clostridium sp.]MDU1977082.1 hypothetical protein [Clostridium sp.]MDU1992650.1 hypothetical protein [Clostridium sp.]MDU6046984.1 hypothetical protein [Clostridium sp.]MDU6220718.1 hypothetical protein [Clostridium sp.]
MPFILIVIGVILVVLNYKALKKDESSFSDVLKYKQKDMTEVEVEIGAIRRDIAESLTELQKEILEIKQHINFNNNVEDIKENLETDEELISNNLTFIDEEVDVINEIDNKNKTEDIRELISLGLNDDEICEKLSLGKGEVLLVRNLYKK